MLPGTIAVVPTAFNGIPKPNCHYILIEPLAMYESEQHLLVPVLEIFGMKLQLCLLCMIIKTNSDEVVLPQNRHLSDM